MLQSLYIKNFALIDELFIEFDNGLNILLGETGAGKSIIIDALMIALGERSSPELVKQGQNKSVIEATFSLDDVTAISDILQEQDNIIDNTFILRREFTTKGTSRSFINDTPYTLNILKEVGNYLVDFHGQHSHQQLLNPAFQLKLLDSIAMNQEEIEKYKKVRKELENAIFRYIQLIEEEQRIKLQKDALEFEFQEIQRINPQPGELQEIENELKKLENYEIINSTLYEIYENLYESSDSALNRLSASIKKMESIVKYDYELRTCLERISSLSFELNEISNEIRSRIGNVNFDREYLENLRTRFSDLKYLSKKYFSYENVFERKDKILQLLTQSLQIEEQIKTTAEEIIKLKEKISALALSIREKRLSCKSYLEGKVPKVLETLGMRNATFEISIYPEEIDNLSIDKLAIELNGKAIKLMENGIDKVEFLIATVQGFKPMPLSTIASGGEISRLMLALKSLSAESYKFPTMVFDEIDAGISGKIAYMAGNLMKQLSKRHQIIVITHLPQIASAGDKVFLVQKMEKGSDVKIVAQPLDENGKISEIAKLISGKELNTSALESAKELIENFKKLVN
ncbi:MAG: DNA repair protein RecN [Ignavibacteria bacterium]|nr:DNA repair protein RecN [Ignavibacteria bacterium]